MNRRNFMGSTLSGAALPGAPAAAAEAGLREKFYGCIVGCHAGSAMGAPCEGWAWERIEETHGTIDRLLPYQHYGNGWNREPGTTEDGVERQKLMITAIIEKRDRVTAEDVRGIWVRDIKPEAAGMVSEPFETQLLAMAKSGIPACDIGRYCDYAGLNSFSRSCHPIGLINAGDVACAAADVYEVGQLYQTTNSRGLQWASITAIAIAAATRPGAGVDSVLEAIRSRGPASVVREIDRGLKLIEKCRDFREARKAFDGIYSGKGTPYAFSSANEVVTKGIAIFKLVNANPRDAIVAAVNFGRDTDCLAAIAGGISGALNGAAAIPREWIQQVDSATAKMPVTNSRRNLREHADGLYEAFRARLSGMRAYAGLMDRA